MPDVAELFERVMGDVHAEPGALERQVARRRRRVAHRRMAAFVAAIMLSGAVGFVFGSRVITGETTTPGSGTDPVTAPHTKPSDGPSGTAPVGESVSTGVLPAGTHSTSSFNPRVTFTVDRGWWVGWDYGEGPAPAGGALSIERRLSEDLFIRVSFWDTTSVGFTYDYPEPGPMPEDLVSFIQERPEVRELSVREIELDGLPATSMEFRWAVRTDAGFLLPGVDPDVAGYRMAYDDAQHWIVVDTSDGQLLIDWTLEDSRSGLAPDSAAQTLKIAERYFNDVVGTVRIDG